MITYSLFELIMFLREQQSNGYQVLNTILSIMYDTDLSPGRQEALVVAILRSYELYEMEYEEEIFFEDSEEFQDVEIQPELEWPEIIPIGLYTCRLMQNSFVEFSVILN